MQTPAFGDKTVKHVPVSGPSSGGSGHLQPAAAHPQSRPGLPVTAPQYQHLGAVRGARPLGIEFAPALLPAPLLQVAERRVVRPAVCSCSPPRPQTHTHTRPRPQEETPGWSETPSAAQRGWVPRLLAPCGRSWRHLGWVPPSRESSQWPPLSCPLVFSSTSKHWRT